MCSETKTGRSYRTLSARDIQAVSSTGNSLFWNLNYRVSTKCNYNQEELKQINQNEVTQSLSLFFLRYFLTLSQKPLNYPPPKIYFTMA